MPVEGASPFHETRRLDPPQIRPGPHDVVDVIETYFNAFNAARLREACRLFARVIDSGATIGLSLSGALTPAGLGSVITTLMEMGFVDYVSSTGANLYHDLHFDLGLPLYRGTAEDATGAADVALRERGIIRVYDVLFPADVLYRTDAWLMRVLSSEELRKRLGTAELHHRIGRYAGEAARVTGTARSSILATAHSLEVPVYSPSPGDSTMGLNLSAVYTADPDRSPVVDPAIDVAEMAAIVLDAKRTDGASAVVILGGGAPKNFLLQSEPQLQEVLGVSERGHDYYIQVTDARPDTGGLSGATPAEAVSWGKIDPERLPDTVVAYVDATIGLPLIASYVTARCEARAPKRLYRRLPEMTDRLRTEYRGSALFQQTWGTTTSEDGKRNSQDLHLRLDG